MIQSSEPEISKKEALKLRNKELKKRWKKKFLPRTLKLLPIKFQKNYKSYKKQKLEVKSWYIYGKAGTGKTVLAGLLFVDAVKKLYFEKMYYPHIKAKFVNFPMMFVEMQKHFGTFEYHKLYDELTTCDVLVIDDVGTKKATDWVGEVFYNIINHRYSNDYLTIITSNYSLQELSNQLNDDRIIRRIEENFEVSKKKHFEKVK